MRTIRANEASTYVHAAGIHQFLASKSKSEVRTLLAYYTAKEIAKELPYVCIDTLIARLEHRISTSIKWRSIITSCAVPFFGDIDSKGRIWIKSLDKAIKWLADRNLHSIRKPTAIRITERYSNPDLYSELNFKYACIRAVAEHVSDNTTKGAKSALKDKYSKRDKAHSKQGYLGGCSISTIAIQLNMVKGAVSNVLTKHKISEAHNTIARETVIGVYSTGQKARAAVLSANANDGFHTYNYNKRRKINARYEVLKKLSNYYKPTHRKIVRTITFSANNPDDISGTPAVTMISMKVQRHISDILQKLKTPVKMIKRKTKRVALFLSLAKHSAAQSISYALETGSEHARNLTDKAHAISLLSYTLKPRMVT